MQDGDALRELGTLDGGVNLGVEVSSVRERIVAGSLALLLNARFPRLVFSTSVPVEQWLASSLPFVTNDIVVCICGYTFVSPPSSVLTWAGL